MTAKTDDRAATEQRLRAELEKAEAVLLDKRRAAGIAVKALEDARIQAKVAPGPAAEKVVEDAHTAYLVRAQELDDADQEAAVLRAALARFAQQAETNATTRRNANRAAALKVLEPRLSEIKARLHAVALDIAVLRLCKGFRDGSLGPVLEGHIDLRRFSADIEPRIVELAKEAGRV